MKAPGTAWEEKLAVASLAALVAITLLNVVTRYLTDESFAWTEEISVFLMVVLALAGGSVVARGDRHIRIELMLRRRERLRLFGALATSLTFAVLAGLFARWVADQVRYSETSMGLGVPLWWYGVFVPPLSLLLSARAFMVFWRGWTRRSPAAPEQDG
ncbi:TRAP transporter small permease [Ramlibacter rhizophilus]|uniref:TRAP transporter small permease protein n=1 Tax=Ramlibacter rhizophilus TaxID=1781167 RepID=A0A4Z0BKJ8_9BURK|nr:TRAP transporter small permease [Ramlibacter rhizophilus]TFY99842.1 TRAP transporter small permease [Ramlibacter rhizophilus]